AAFVKTGYGIQVGSVDDLNAYNVVRVAGVLHTEAATANVPNVQAVTDPSQMFKMVSAGRADIAMSGYIDGLSKLRKFGMGDLEALEPPLRELELFHYLHEANADLVPVIDAVVSEMAASGELTELRLAKEEAYLATY
ncbi:MAG: transporter substrate-binding domain-containing protein, partial [Pseudomonadota bacterium]